MNNSCNEEKEVILQKFDNFIRLHDEAINKAECFLNDLKNNGINKRDWELFKREYLLDTDKSYTKYVETIEKNDISLTKEVYVQEIEMMENGSTKLVKKSYSEEKLEEEAITLLGRMIDILRSEKEYFITKIGKDGFAEYVKKFRKKPYGLGLTRGFSDYYWGTIEGELYCKLIAIENFHASL